MSQATNYFEDLVCNFFRGSNITGITPYVGLFDGDPTDTGTGATEVTTTVRTLGRLAVNFSEPDDGEIENDADVDFGESEGDTTIAAFGIFDAQSSGNLICYGTFTSQSIVTGNQVLFEAGNLKVAIL